MPLKDDTRAALADMSDDTVIALANAGFGLQHSKRADAIAAFEVMGDEVIAPAIEELRTALTEGEADACTFVYSGDKLPTFYINAKPHSYLPGKVYTLRMSVAKHAAGILRRRGRSGMQLRILPAKAAKAADEAAKATKAKATKAKPKAEG